MRKDPHNSPRYAGLFLCYYLGTQRPRYHGQCQSVPLGVRLNPSYGECPALCKVRGILVSSLMAVLMTCIVDTMEKFRAVYQTPGRVSVDYVVIHWINGTLDSCIATFTGGDRQASAHYGVEGKRVVEFVKDGDTAWSLGNWAANQRSISVEHSAQPGRPATDETYQTSIELIYTLMVKHNLYPSRDTIRPHNHFSATQCPGTMDLDRIITGVEELFNKTAIMPQATETEEDDMFTQTDRENLEKIVRTNETTQAMLNNMAGALNGLITAIDQGKPIDEETMGNARKLVEYVIDGKR